MLSFTSLSPLSICIKNYAQSCYPSGRYVIFFEAKGDSAPMAASTYLDELFVSVYGSVMGCGLFQGAHIFNKAVKLY